MGEFSIFHLIFLLVVLAVMVGIPALVIWAVISAFKKKK